jgi:hexosaminidase
MKSSYSFIILLLSVFSFINGKMYSQTNNLPGVIPAPNSVINIGKNSGLKEIKLYIPEEAKSAYFDHLFKDLKMVSWQNEKNANTTCSIDKRMTAEGYKLFIEKDKISIKAGSKVGLQYALVSLAQMLTHKGLPLPQTNIEDKPAFEYRGLHLDVGRHFYKADDIKKFIDYMAYYKYNQFHWHLTEDQGWRIEIKKYPKLQEIGAFRKETVIGQNTGQYDGKRYGGYYTQEEVKDIVRYAMDRNINVIPEIEMPGHSLAALASYPELGCENKKYEVATKWGVFDDVYCPTENTFQFLQDVLDEVMVLFPSKYIHIGGDECPKEAWKKSAFCQELIKKENLKDEHELQSYFIQRMEKYINSKGRQIIGWDEILEGGLAPNATVMSWRGTEGGIEAARQNHDVIMTPGSHCYFDHYQSLSSDEPLAIGGYTNVEKVYHWQPVPKELEAEKRKYILGGQANVWTEYIKDFPHVEYMTYARGLAMSEALWSKERNYKAFLSKYEIHNDYWKSKGANIANHLYELTPKVWKNKNGNINVSFLLPRGANILYSIDGQSEKPFKASQIFELKTSGNHSFTAAKGDKKGNPLNFDLDFHKATKAAITIDPAPSPKYNSGGNACIINGIKGSNNKFKDDEWLGFDKTDATIALDFKMTTDINTINCRFYRSEGSWIFLPSALIAEASDDGKTYKKVGEITQFNSKENISEVEIKTNGISSRYIRLTVKNFGPLPADHPGAGKKGWLFIDEITVK